MSQPPLLSQGQNTPPAASWVLSEWHVLVSSAGDTTPEVTSAPPRALGAAGGVSRRRECETRPRHQWEGGVGRGPWKCHPRPSHKGTNGNLGRTGLGWLRERTAAPLTHLSSQHQLCARDTVVTEAHPWDTGSPEAAARALFCLSLETASRKASAPSRHLPSAPSAKEGVAQLCPRLRPRFSGPHGIASAMSDSSESAKPPRLPRGPPAPGPLQPNDLAMRLAHFRYMAWLQLFNIPVKCYRYVKQPF